MRFTSSGKLSISVPVIKNVAFALFASRQSRSLPVNELGPSSKVRATAFLEDSGDSESFLPETSEESGFWKVEVTLTSGTCIELTFNIPLLVCPVIGNQHKGSGLVTFRHGTLVLGSPDAEKAVKISELVDDGAGRYRTQSATFTPLDQAYMLEESDLKSTAYRILYQVQ